MKKFLLMLTAGALLVACGDKKKEADEKNAASVTVTMPYPAAYSASFGLGNPAYATMVVQGSWKDWETNNLDNMKNWVADTVVVFHSDNVMAKGLDSLMARWKRGRAGYTTVIDSIDAVMPVYSTDKKENWVLVWAREINTDTKGKTDTSAIMETWRINKDGKADMLLQYDRATRKK
ncbi:MAG: hypothetical protein IPQ06_13545 [Chitinophagaceae bacterium]|nr:hypothetical protein [Chitinophagaceae bacterium]